MIISIFILKWIYSKFNKLKILYKIILDSISKRNIVWMFIHIQFQFLLINLSIDAIEIKQHMLLSLLSFGIIFLLIIYTIVSSPEMVSLDFIKLLERSSPASYTLIIILKMFCNAWLFIFENRLPYIISAVISWVLHVAIILIHLFSTNEYTVNELLERGSIIIKNSMLVIILIFIFTNDIFSNNIYSRTTIIMITTFFIIWLLIDLLIQKLSKKNTESKKSI